MKIQHTYKTVDGVDMHMDWIDEVMLNSAMHGHLLISIKHFMALWTRLWEEDWGSKGGENGGDIKIGEMGTSIGFEPGFNSGRICPRIREQSPEYA